MHVYCFLFFALSLFIRKDLFIINRRSCRLSVHSIKNFLTFCCVCLIKIVDIIYLFWSVKGISASTSFMIFTVFPQNLVWTGGPLALSSVSREDILIIFVCRGLLIGCDRKQDLTVAVNPTNSKFRGHVRLNCISL